MRIIDVQARDGYAILTARDERLGLVTRIAAALDASGTWQFVGPDERAASDKLLAEALADGTIRAQAGRKVRHAEWEK